MKNVLLISQSQDASYVNIINDAVFENGGKLTVFTGKTEGISSCVNVKSAPKYNSVSFLSRFKTWYLFSKEANRFLKSNIHEYDCIMFTSNPPINQRLLHYAFRKNIKCIYLIWDIYPDCIEKSFGRKVLPITFLWRKVNRKLYQKCDAVITIGDVMKHNIQKSYSGIDIKVIPYHTDTDFIKPIKNDENIFLKEYGFYGKKVFMYSGKMGFGHGFDEMLEVAKRLKDRKDIVFVFIGHGSAYKDIEKYIENNQLHNARLLPYQPLEMLPYSLGAADVSFITIKEQTDGLFLPSKVYDAMASSSAIICISGGNNDVARMVEKENIGIQLKGSNVEELHSAVVRLADDEDFLENCQKRARELAVRDYDIKVITKQYKELFEKVMKGEEKT